MARFSIDKKRFPFERTPIRTRLGIVWFVDQAAVVDDEDLAAAVREVPPVFGIVEEGGSPAPAAEEASGGDDGDASKRPSVRAPKAAWVAYAEQEHGIPAAEAEEMTKAELIETFGG